MKDPLALQRRHLIEEMLLGDRGIQLLNGRDDQPRRVGKLADQLVRVVCPVDAAVGRMLATFAAAGVQLLVETHSDHVLNGARLAVRDGVIASEDISLLFFAGVSSEGHDVTTPRVDREGRINEWPEGFFDQGDKDISRLSGWD